MSEAISIFKRDTELSIKSVNTRKIRWFWSWIKKIDDRGRYGGDIISIPLYKSFKPRMMG